MVKLLKILFERERACMLEKGGGAEGERERDRDRERERERERIASRLHTQPNAGPDPTNHEIMT